MSTSAESEHIEALIQNWAKAVRAQDIEGVLKNHVNNRGQTTINHDNPTNRGLSPIILTTASTRTGNSAALHCRKKPRAGRGWFSSSVALKSWIELQRLGMLCTNAVSAGDSCG